MKEFIESNWRNATKFHFSMVPSLKKNDANAFLLMKRKQFFDSNGKSIEHVFLIRNLCKHCYWLVYAGNDGLRWEMVKCSTRQLVTLSDAEHRGAFSVISEKIYWIVDKKSFTDLSNVLRL